VAEPTASNQAPPTTATSGRLIAARYELTTRIASGGMAEVWEAHDQVLDRRVAVKILHRHLAENVVFTQRFRAEALAAARLHHSSIVSIYDTSSDDGLDAIVMELVRGQTLRDRLDEHGPLAPEEVVHIGASVADALHVAHRSHIVHRDIKPANILLCNDQRVVVTDFGIAKVRDDTDLTMTGTMLGTVKYLAPEQVEGRPVDPRTDIYGLGVVLYEALAGEPPFDADSVAATALARLHQDPPALADRRSEVPPALAGIVMRALAREPSDRFGTAQELRGALVSPRTLLPPAPVAASAGGTDATAFAPRPALDDAPPPGRSWVVPTLLVLLVGASIGVAVALLARTQETGFDRPDVELTAPAAVTIDRVATFDPQGDGVEHDGRLRFAFDADESTVWHTETYQPPGFGGGSKSGVGVYLTLSEPAAVQRLRVVSRSNGWSAQVFVAPEPANTLAGWGAAVADQSDIAGNAEFDLRGEQGSAVLLWITGLPDDSPRRVEIAQVELAV
jgi:eukaryotic-like serine/threonine-protein kinase